jgi:aryl-alcohol dehydrogenase-like predicted oxidoreductase
MKRRQFISKTAAGMGGVMVSSLGAFQGKPIEKYDPFEFVPLGKTGLNTPRVSFGTGLKGSQRSSAQTRAGKEHFERLIQATYERGVRQFDMADLYGSHPYLIPALRGKNRNDYIILTKIWFRRGGIPEPERPDADIVVKRFLKELQTDYIDIVLLHCTVSPNWPQEQRKHMDLLYELKEKEIIRAVGVSCHSLDALTAAAKEPWVDTVNTRINPFGISMDDTPEKVVPVLQEIHAAGKGIVGMKIIGEGKYKTDTEKINQSIDYVLNLGCVDIMTVGFEEIEEVDDFASRVRKVEKKI